MWSVPLNELYRRGMCPTVGRRLLLSIKLPLTLVNIEALTMCFDIKHLCEPRKKQKNVNIFKDKIHKPSWAALWRNFLKLLISPDASCHFSWMIQHEVVIFIFHCEVLEASFTTAREFAFWPSPLFCKKNIYFGFLSPIIC